MTKQLHDLFDSEHPVSLPQIERALTDQPDLSTDQDAVLSALIWRRRTNGGANLLGTVLHRDCASRISDLPDHLQIVGADDAAKAVSELLDEIALENDQIEAGLLEWVETEPELVIKAQELGDDLEDIDAIVWDFMKQDASDIPDLEISTRMQQLVSSIKKVFWPKHAEG